MITNLLLVFTGLLGFITLFIILFSYKSNRLINVYIAIIIFFFSVRFLLLGVNYLMENAPLSQVIQKTRVYFIFLAPCFYLYFKNLIDSQKNFKKSDLLHFVTPLLVVVLSKFEIIKNLLKIDDVTILLSIFSIMTITYIVMVFFKLKYIWTNKDSFEIVARQSMLIKKWSVYLFVVIVLTAFRLLISLFFEANNNEFISGQSFLWLTSVLWLFLFAKILSSPEILYGYPYLSMKFTENIKQEKMRISSWKSVSKVKINNHQDLALYDKINQNIIKYMDDIETFTYQKNYFRSQKVSLNEFAIKLNIPKSHVTFLFKYHSELSFSEYKKNARIKDALKQIDSNYLENNTFESLAKKVGFSSYNPFFTSFKDIVGKSPQEYYTSWKQRI